jgi:Mor family transcriptional regulator
MFNKKRHSFKITDLKRATRPVCYDGGDLYYFPKFESGNTKTRLKNITKDRNHTNSECLVAFTLCCRGPF